MKQKPLLGLLTATLWVVLTQSVGAHSGHGHHGGFLHGIEHPLFGLDHLLAMVAVGLWAAQLGSRAVFLVPLSFVSVMALGGAIGMLGWSMPLVEPGIVGSVFVLGLLIALAFRCPTWAAMLLVGIFAAFHGFAHGAEMPQGASGIAYAAGFILATAGLHAGGILLGVGLQKIQPALATRLVGGAIAASAMVLALL